MTKWNNDPQGARIAEEWQAALAEGLENFDMFELEAIFEDRDPAEFI
jgi:hypothetical protein